MLKQHNQLMVSFLVITDACAVALSWIASYALRFSLLPINPEKGIPPFTSHFLPLLPLVVVAHLIVFARVGLYRPRRDQPVWREIKDILKAFPVAVVIVILIDYALPQSNKISRQFMATYAVVGTTLFAFFRVLVRTGLHLLRRRGWNQRSAAIIGSGRTAQLLDHALRRNAWTGIHVDYFVDHRPRDQEGELAGRPLLGPLEQLDEILEHHPVDAIFIALPTRESHRTPEILSALGNSLADVRLVPEINPSFVVRLDVSKLDDVPILSLRQAPLEGWNVVLKRVFDLLVGGLCLLIALPFMALIALLIKLTSRGPVFYTQRRMGLDGRQFDIIKFRTMIPHAEKHTGPVWAAPDDSRRTRVGAILRRTSLDELPNLFNVLAGQMSLVGPRPERPELIEQFKNDIPRYMLRHKIKAGMTGYAQIKGLRGNTSLKKRVQHDLHYLQNWSLGLDLRILARTLTGGWLNKTEI